MKWILKLMFPSLYKPVRINKDYLPGLTPPKVAPFTPRLPKQAAPPEPDIKGLHKKFILSGGSKATTKRPKNDRGVGF
jgi:hypothetical protein